MPTATIQARPVLPRLGVQRGLLEPYDLLLVGGWLVAAIVGWVSGYSLLTPQAWLLPNVGWIFGLFLVGLALLLPARLLNLKLRHRRLPTLAFRVALARHFGLSTLLHALRFAVAFELVRLPVTVLVQRLPWFRTIPHRPDLPQVWDAQVYHVERLIHFGFDLPAALAAAPWPTWMAAALDGLATHWMIVPAMITAYALSCSRRLRVDRFLVALLGVWLACPLLALALPTTGPFLVQQDIFPAAGMTMTAELQQQRFLHWNMHLFPGRDGALIDGFGLMGFPSLPAAVLAVCALFCWRTCRAASFATLLAFLAVIVAMLASGWHHTLGVYAGVLLALAVWWSAGVLMRCTTGCREFRPDAMLH